MEKNLQIADATAIVLAGGKSSRMGRPKALLPFDGEPLIAHVVRALKTKFSETVVVAAPEQKLPELPAVLARDEIAYQGPVSGIYQGLQAATHECCFVTSCDGPFLNLSLVTHLMGQISQYDVVVPFWQERLQPLHAVYRKTVAPLLREQLERGELRPIFLYDKVRTHKVQEDEIRRVDPEGRSFMNMNTPEEYEAALRLWRTEEGVNSRAAVSVELFGAARLLAKKKEIFVPVPEQATLAHVFAALAQQVPVLLGRVLDSEGLLSGYTCNINGLDFVRTPDTKINRGDKIFILSADAGG